MKHKIEFDQKCDSCNGTGLYSGMGEGDDCAVVCHTCNGDGHYLSKIAYEDFDGRVNAPKIKWVYQVNPGIMVGSGNGYKHSDFGGMSKKDWLSGKKFGLGTENRLSACPAWWYQSADYGKKPHWKECICCGSFSSCKHFKNKKKCWERFDRGAK